MPAHRTQNSRHLRVEAASIETPPINIISPTPQTFIFDTDAINAQASEAGSYSFASQASRSLPNLFTFHASPNGEYSSNTGAHSPTGSQTSSMYTSYDSPMSVTSTFFASPASSFCGSSYASSPPGSSGTPSLSPSPPPFSPTKQDTGSERRRTGPGRSRSCSSPAPYPHPLPPHSNGQVRTQPPRPPNPWICFRNVRSAQYKELNYPEFPKHETRGQSAPSSPAAGTMGLDGEIVRRPRQADLSKHISLEWKSLTDEEKAPYVRMSEEAKLVHARVYPGYKYQPRRKNEAASATKKNSLRPDAFKKSGKSRKSNKGKTVSKDDAPCEIETEEKLSDQPDDLTHGVKEMGIAQVQLPILQIDFGAHEEAHASAGDPSKEWTWLPEETLLPITWDLDQEGFGSGAASNSIMHPLDANVEEGNESNQIEFGKPFYLSFSPEAHDQSSVAPFFPFPTESESESAFFAVPGFDFQGSSLDLQDCHLDDFPDLSQLADNVVQDIANDFGLRRDSIDSSSGCKLLESDTPGNMGESLGFTSGEMYAGGRSPFTTSKSPESPERRSSVPSLPPINTAVSSFSPRRASIASTSLITSPDGFLRPPTNPLISQTRPRVRSKRSMSLKDARTNYNDVRSIPTTSFSASSGITTSVLIPMAVPTYDMDLERDLEEYSQAMSTVASEPQQNQPSSLPPVSPPLTSFMKGEARAARNQILEDDDVGLNAQFDFEAEFADIIDMHASRVRLAST